MRDISKFLLLAFFCLCCNHLQTSAQRFTDREKRIIERSDSVMYVTTIFDASDWFRLIAPSEEIPLEEVNGKELKRLISLMRSTVTSEEQDGVGIAAPQVGINRRLVVLQRVDKPDKPFEAYVNLRIDRLAGNKVEGKEGCLSVPGFSGLVERSDTIEVSYLDTETMQRVGERVSGFAAVIFQHEADHLDGTLYTMRAKRIWRNEAWQKEIDRHRRQGAYRKPSWWED